MFSSYSLSSRPTHSLHAPSSYKFLMSVLYPDSDSSSWIFSFGITSFFVTNNDICADPRSYDLSSDCEERAENFYWWSIIWCKGFFFNLFEIVSPWKFQDLILFNPRYLISSWSFWSFTICLLIALNKRVNQ